MSDVINIQDEKKIKETYIKSRVPNEMAINGRRIKKPGFFTRLKAFFRIGSAKRKVEAYEKAKEQLQNMPAKLQQAVEHDQRSEEERNTVYENRLQSSLDLFEMTDEKIPNRDEENKADLLSVIKDFKNSGSDGTNAANRKCS